jgi:hypothetical protein
MDSKESGEANIMLERPVVLQHGTGVDGNLHPYIKVIFHSMGFMFKNPHVKLSYLYIILY